MIIYSTQKSEFLKDLSSIPTILKETINRELGEEPSENEVLSWKNSLRFMANVVDTSAIPNDAGITLEYNIPVTNNRIDFIISGYDSKEKLQAIIIELKQWSDIRPTNKDGVVIARYSDGLKETAHPSYQVDSYASLLSDFKEVVQNGQVSLHPCVYLHNYCEDKQITNHTYDHYVKKAPVFCKGDQDKLREFICNYIHKGDRAEAINKIENSKIVPSKSLIDCVVKMAAGSPEFKLVDDQKVVYQNILWAYDEYQRTKKKQVVIIEGGPGTGKSVIAIQVLVEMTRRRLLAHYITKNAAPRNVMYSKFIGDNGMASSFQYLMKSSGIYYNKQSNEFDMLIVDEAHRLQKHSGAYGNWGENQIKEIINASKVSVFFIDENQIVSLQDIGSISEIKNFANEFGTEIHELNLESQFRCSGSDVYINWLNHLLQYDNLLPIHLKGTTYEFKVMDTPTDLMNQIKSLNSGKNKSRVVAGYCWPWKSRTNPIEKDIVFPECEFAYKWNLYDDRTWSISEGSIDQIGCIHTCQGLEFEYVGVIIGNDMICRDGKILVDPSKRAPDDFSVRDWQQLRHSNPEEAKKLMRRIIKNTYRTLLTRGMKGCYVYACDSELQQYLKEYSKLDKI